MQPSQQPASPTSPRRRRLVKGAVYGALVVLVVAIGLTARGFTREVGDARVAGRYSLLPLFQSRTPAQLALTWNGLTLHFSRARTPSVQGFESEGDATDIVFDNGSRLRLEPGSDAGGSLSLTPGGPAAGATAAPGAAPASVVVPFTVEGIVQDPPPTGAALAWKHAGRTFLLSLPPGSESDPENGTLTLPLAGTAAAVLQAQGVARAASHRTAPAGPSTAAARLPREEDMPGADTLQAAVSAWTGSAWQGWSSSRYSASDASWRMADGKRGFSEDIGVALLSESVARGSWQTAFSLWSGALAAQQGRGPSAPLAFVTSAYVGGVKDFVSAVRKTSDDAASRASAAIDQGDASVLSVAGLIPLILDHGSPALLDKAARYLANRSPAALDLASACGLAGDLVDYLALVHSDETMQRLLKDTVEKRILPAARALDSGVFLDPGNGTSDVRLDVLAGALLLRAGPAAGSSLASAVGRGLLVSSLALSDNAGFLPASLVMEGTHVTRPEGTIAPESIYALLPSARFVPRETPLASTVGAGAWVWTSAPVASASGTPGGVTLVFSYPRGVPYHLAIHGLRPFTTLKLHGIPWHSDPTYFKYSDGWSYDSSSQTMYMKITGRTDLEQVEIQF